MSFLIVKFTSFNGCHHYNKFGDNLFEAPKGWNISAQGEALRKNKNVKSALKGRNKKLRQFTLREVIPPFQGFKLNDNRNTGRCPVLLIPPFQGFKLNDNRNTGRCPVLLIPPFQGFELNDNRNGPFRALFNA
jgi:hypothetical protein